MSTHNICFHREIRKILCGYSLLSVAMLLMRTHYVWFIEELEKIFSELSLNDLLNYRPELSSNTPFEQELPNFKRVQENFLQINCQ